MASNPAVAVASFIIHAYKRRSVLTAQNADAAQTTVGVTYLRSMENVQTKTCALCVHHSQICAWQQQHQHLHCIV